MSDSDLKQRDVLVVFSGGQDSTTCLHWALREFRSVRAVFFDYGQRHAAEREAAAAIAARLGVDLRVFRVDGREVAHLARGTWSAGSHEVAWSGRDSRGASVASGVYFLRFATEDGVETRRVVRFR